MLPNSYIPIRVLSKGSKIIIHACEHDGFLPCVPNFRLSANRLLESGKRQVLLPLDNLEIGDMPPPRGLLLHTSRCGSTLLNRMLGTLGGVLSLSEAWPIADVFALPGLSTGQRARVLWKV